MFDLLHCGAGEKARDFCDRVEFQKSDGMLDDRQHKRNSISLPGILAFLCGVFFLFAYWKFPPLDNHRDRFIQVLFISTSAIMALWGLKQLGQNSKTREAPGRRADPSDSAGLAGDRAQAIPWLGIVLILIGSQLIYAVITRSEQRLFVVTAWIAGGLFIVGGAYEVVRAVLPSTEKGRPRNRQALSTQGGVYLAMMIVMFVGSLIGRSNMLMLVFSLMAGPFVAGGWMTFTMLKRLKVRRRLPRRVMAGDRVWVDLILENDKQKVSSWLMDVTDEIRGNGELLQTGVLFARVPPRSHRTGKYELRLMQRGRYELGPITITTRFPLGFVERGLEFDVSNEVLVYPRLGELLPAWKADRPTDTELVQSQRPQQNIYDDEFHRLREFRWGDNPRAIHWRTSARRNELMMREYQQTRQQDLTILLDLWIPKTPTDDDWERVEMAVSFAATVGVEHMRDSRDSTIVLLAAGQRETQWEGQAGPACFDSYLESLAVVQPACEPNARWLAEKMIARDSAVSRTLIVSSRTPSSEPGGVPETHGVPEEIWNNRPPQCEIVFAGSPDLARLFQIPG